MTINSKCAIVGIGQTEFSKDSGKSELSLALEAIMGAIEDAGLSPKEIDGVVRYRCDTSATDMMIATNLGMPELRFSAEVPYFGGSAGATVAQAAAAVEAGLANCIVCFRALNLRSAGWGSGIGESEAAEVDSRDFLQAFGFDFPMDIFAMMCRRHMHEYGTTSRQLGAIAVAERKYGAMNPHAMRRKPITIEDHQKSKLAVDPLHELDSMFTNDGACAVVVTSKERARDLKQRPVNILAAAQGHGPLPQTQWDLEIFRPVITETAAKYVAPHLFGMAGIKPSDINVAEIYDCFTYTVLVQLEDYGFCKKGEGGPFVENGRLELGGQLPTNTHGGHLSEGYVHGFTHILEGVRQIRGTSTAQVKDAELALVTSAIPGPTSALIMGR
jgi:acetyl-CoA acetyltransferase